MAVAEVNALRPLEEKCGIVGIYSRRFTPQLPLALLAATAIQHRGQQGTGLAWRTKSGLKTHKSPGLLRELFTNQLQKVLAFPSQWVLFHCRYGTHGDYNETNIQPCLAKSPQGDTVVVIHNGEFTGVSRLKRQVKEIDLCRVSDTYLFTQALAGKSGSDWDERVTDHLKQIKGAYSLIIGIGDSLYISRDQFGIRPLMIGKVKDQWLVASETHAFSKVGARMVRSVKQGEVIKLGPRGIKQLQSPTKGAAHFCDFEWAYFSRPDSAYPIDQVPVASGKTTNWLTFAEFRERCGKLLARQVPVLDASFVVGVPDSGIPLANGYAIAAKLPYRQVIIRDHFDPNGNQRLFMRDDQKSAIGKKVLGKLSLVPDRRIWKDAVVVIGDDSIVRGNVSQRIIQAAFGLGAREVHLVIGFPPVRYRCHLGISMRTEGELIAARFRGDPDRIARAIGASSVTYITIKNFIQARLPSPKLILPKNKSEIFLCNSGCGGCITGRYPISRRGVVYKGK